MFSVMITVNYGMGEEIHSASGTYGLLAISNLIEHWSCLHHMVSIEITPSN